MNYTIDRKTWLRGEGSAISRLLRDRDRKMCCLGQICLQHGIPRERLLGITAPDHTALATEFAALPGWWHRPDRTIERSLDLSDAMAINDSQHLSDDVRESKLIALFAQHGDTLTFIN